MQEQTDTVSGGLNKPNRLAVRAVLPLMYSSSTVMTFCVTSCKSNSSSLSSRLNIMDFNTKRLMEELSEAKPNSKKTKEATT